MTEKYAVVVVGGGAAGLSAALVLGRARQRTLVVDAGEPRNAPAAHMQGFLTRDGMPPAEFLAIGREEIARYGVELVRDRVVEVERGRDGTVEQGEDFAVVLAAWADRTGPAAGRRHRAEGRAARGPRAGRAVRPGRAALPVLPRLGGARPAVRRARDGPDERAPGADGVPVVEGRAVLPAHGRRGGAVRRGPAPLAAAGVDVVPGEVAGLVVEDDRLTGVRLAGDTPSGEGTTHARSVLFVAPHAVPQTGLLEQLGAELHETPFGAYPVVDATGLTTVPGVWAAGNAIGFAEQVVHAASGGTGRRPRSSGIC